MTIKNFSFPVSNISLSNTLQNFHLPTKGECLVSVGKRTYQLIFWAPVKCLGFIGSTVCVVCHASENWRRSPGDAAQTVPNSLRGLCQLDEVFTDKHKPVRDRVVQQITCQWLSESSSLTLQPNHVVVSSALLRIYPVNLPHCLQLPV